MHLTTSNKGMIALTMGLTAITAGLYGDVQEMSKKNVAQKTEQQVNKESCGRWIVAGDLLFWTVSEDGMTYGYKYKDKDIPGQPVPRDISKYHSFKFDWNAGFRAMTGYEFKGCFELTGAWTRFTADTHSHARQKGRDFAAGATLFFPTWDNNESFVDRWHGHLDLTLNLLDVAFARNFSPAHNLSLKPSIGVRTAWINQEMHSKSRFVGFLQDEQDLEKVELENEFTGVGPRAGFVMDWHLGRNFSLFGSADISVLWGRFEVEYETTTYADINNTGRFNAANVAFDARQKNTYSAVRAITDLGLGFKWQKYFRDDRSIFTILLSWEQHIFFNQNRFEEFHQLDTINPSFNRGDLMTSGVTFGLRLDY